MAAESHGAAGPDRQRRGLEFDLLLEGAQVPARSEFDPRAGDEIVADRQVPRSREGNPALGVETAAHVFHVQIAMRGTEGQRVQRSEAVGVLDHQAPIGQDAHGAAFGLEQRQSRTQLADPVHVEHVDRGMGERFHLFQGVHRQM